MCGDGVCQKNGEIPENFVNCEQDCPDSTPPVVTYILDPPTPDGNDGWYRNDVTLIWTVFEPESPDSLVKSECVNQSITVDQEENTYSCSAASDGGQVGPVEVTIKRDATPPTVSVLGVEEDAEYLFGNAPAAECQTMDSLSGVAVEAVPVVSGATMPGVGELTAACAGGEDQAGNTTADVMVSYRVVFDWAGFFQPVDNPPQVNWVKAGAALSIKFSLAGDHGLGVLSSNSPVSVPIACDGVGASGTMEEAETAGGSSLSYDPVTSQYIFVWKTSKTWAGTCRQLQVMLVDGKRYVANFDFIK
jgi:hypothetical protein